MRKEQNDQLAELSVRMTAISKAIHLKECELASLKYQYEQVSKQFWAVQYPELASTEAL